MSHSAVELSRSTPESVGFSSKNILEFVEESEAKGLELHSFMLLRENAVVAEGWWAPYRRNDVHLLYSLSKSFTSTAIGFAIQEGRLTLDDSVLSFFPDEAPADPSEHLKRMKVRHLLSMSTGQDNDDLYALRNGENEDWVRLFLRREVPYEPGSYFLYNSTATYMLSAIITVLTGETTLDYLRPRLLDPLGIDKVTWETCPKGRSVGGWGMSITTEAILRFGRFYRDRGVWNGTQLLDPTWIDDATRAHASNGTDPDSDWNQGYGFQFWRCRHDCYRGDGAFGQFCVVMPHLNSVVAITASVNDLQGVLNLVWKHLLLPASDHPLPADAEACEALRQKLGTLQLPPPEGEPFSPIGVKASGRVYHCTSGSEGIKSCVFDFDPEGCTFNLRTVSGDRSIRVGNKRWIRGVTSIEGSGGKPIAAIGRWTTPDTFEIKIRNTDSPSGMTIQSRFTDEKVAVEVQLRSRFGPPEGPKFEAETRKGLK